MNFSTISIDNISPAKTHRISSWDKSGGNKDFWVIPAGESKVLLDTNGPGRITHIWMTTWSNMRNLLIKITWDDASFPSVLVPYGDFFGQGNCIVNSYQSAFFSSSTDNNNKMNEISAFNCYIPMPFRKQAKIELINESKADHLQYFYIDYELYPDESFLGPNPAYFHAEFHRQNPFGGWGPEIRPNTPETDYYMNKERDAWQNNYVLVETKGKGHYIGCNISVTNLQATSFGSYGAPGYSWWGEGDDMIWVDGYNWPPDLHGTGSEDYFNQANGMQRNAFWRNGASIHEFDTAGYSTSYIFHIENPVRFEKEIKVTIEIGHGNHLGNEISSVAYWYAEHPSPIRVPPPVDKRQPILKKDGKWVFDQNMSNTDSVVPISQEIHFLKQEWARKKISSNYQSSVGLLSEDSEKKICMTIRNIPQVPIEEILEDIGNKPILLNLFGNLTPFQFSDINRKSIENLYQILRPYVGKRVKMVIGSLLDHEKDQKHPAELIVLIHDRISFRD